MAETIEEIVEELRGEWKAGSGSALIKAFVWCTNEGVQFPEWLTRAVVDELEWSFDNRPRAGGNKSSSGKREANDRKHRLRFALVKQILEFQQFDLNNGLRSAPLNETEAAKEAADILGGKHPAWGTTDAILKSYRSLKSG